MNSQIHPQFLRVSQGDRTHTFGLQMFNFGPYITTEGDPKELSYVVEVALCGYNESDEWRGEVQDIDSEQTCTYEFIKGE